MLYNNFEIIIVFFFYFQYKSFKKNIINSYISKSSLLNLGNSWNRNKHIYDFLKKISKEKNKVEKNI